MMDKTCQCGCPCRNLALRGCEPCDHCGCDIALGCSCLIISVPDYKLYVCHLCVWYIKAMLQQKHGNDAEEEATKHNEEGKQSSKHKYKF